MVAIQTSLPTTPTRIVEVEMYAPHARQVFFRPIRRALRGHADFAREKSKAAAASRDVWPDPIPGQVVGITEAGEKYVREPLHDREHTKVALQIKNRGLLLPDERESFESETVLTWLYWMRRIVDSGMGRVVKGELPPIEELEPKAPRKRDDSKARKSFILDESQESPVDKLADAMDRLALNVAANTAVMQHLLEKLAK